jgi:hypothetical protein
MLQGITILGLYGTTWDAFNDAAAAAQSAAAAANNIDEHNNTDPQFRTPLKLAADALYKVVVATQTAGTTDGGKTVKLFPDDQPANEDVQEFWFRTATLPEPGAAVVHHPPRPELAWREFAWEQTVFQTNYLARYLKSYTPGDRTQHWYLADDLVANFDVDHVDQLAGLYRYRLDLHCQRTDGPPSRDDNLTPWTVVLTPRWTDLYDTNILDPLGQRYLAVDPAVSCPVPKSGASLKGSTDDLQPLATYQLNVTFIPNHVDGQPDPPPAAPLPGIIFSTSRYRNPDDQLADLGFQSPAGSPHGQLFIAAAALPAPETSDAAFAAALTAFGMEGWPLPEPSGRTSLLWSADTTNLAGVLVESPEPLSRPNRLEINNLQVNGVNFTGRYGDSAQCRYLFTPPAPIAIGPTQPVTLSLSYTDAGTAKTATCTTTSPAAGEVIL